jgi:hypothetical protein
LRPQPAQTYEVEALFAIRFLLPFPAKLGLLATVDLPQRGVLQDKDAGSKAGFFQPRTHRSTPTAAMSALPKRICNEQRRE